MIEKIPIVIPEAVRADRSLFAPSDFQAILMISRLSIDYLTLVLQLARRWCRPLMPWIVVLEARKLHDLAIRGAIMRKLLHIAFGILRHQQPFNPELVFLPKTV